MAIKGTHKMFYEYNILIGNKLLVYSEWCKRNERKGKMREEEAKVGACGTAPSP